MMDGMMGGMMLWMLLPGLFVLAVVALLVVWAARQGAGGNSGAAGRQDAALETLRRRYAAGELSEEQYRRMARDLGAQEPWPQA